jgi:hypothetical protein
MQLNNQWRIVKYTIYNLLLITHNNILHVKWKEKTIVRLPTYRTVRLNWNERFSIHISLCQSPKMVKTYFT